MMSHYKSLFVLLLLAVSLGGCSKENSDAVYGAHPEGWLCTHSTEALQNASGCTSCHGADYNGSGQVPGCFSCHLGSAPTFSAHPDSWANVNTDHRTFAFENSWTTCAVADCHGGDLQGGSNSLCATGPSCFTAACHPAPGSPPAAHVMPFAPANLHGPDAKNFYSDQHGSFYCRNCHGTPLNNFDGGFVTDAILGRPVPNGACSACHPNAKAHYTNWQGANDGGVGDLDPTYNSTHRTVDQLTIDNSCALCHKTSSVGSGPMPGAPSCYSTLFTNANGIASSCHQNGPGAAPHATNGTYTDPQNHGPDAKTNLGLDFCKGCHARPIANGYRFDVQVGSLINGCEDCHTQGAAHPPASLVLPSTDRWTFRGSTDPRRTHFAATAPQTNCTLCHGANLDGVNATAPSCLTCHAETVQFSLNCSACHGTPPSAATNVPGATPVNHTTVTDQAGFNSAHDECTICHGAKETISGGILEVVGTDYLLFDRNTPALMQGGDHLDGNIEMNGPTPATGAGYDETSFNCTNACHSDLTPFILSDSALPVEYGNYGNSPGSGCTFCHGYPPDGTPDLTGATPVDHTAVTNPAGFMTAHNDCSTCHGVKDDGTGTHLPTGNYNVATDHQNGSINLNLDTQYDQTTFGCNAACHANAAPFQFTDSGLPVVLDSYGSSGGSSACDSCHTTGVGGAPVVIAGTTNHTGSWTCEDCHTAHGAGDVIIPNNTTVGINYPAAGHMSGISLGGAATNGTTEADICWNCHDTLGYVSEWGVNNNANTGSMNYNYGTVDSSDWTVATWTSGTGAFSYKTGAIQSTHSVNSAGTAAVSGPDYGKTETTDSVANIRCAYCHDVHDLNKATGDTLSGAPYLRGTWMGNPYKEDGAPQSGTNYSAVNNWGAVPRGSNSTAMEMGGYWIDQNSGNPTSVWTLADSAGLCTLCHGTNVNTMDDTLGENLWVGTNGHSNAVIGGTGVNAFNVFDSRGGQNGYTDNPYQHFQGMTDPADNGNWGFRSNNSNAHRYTPYLANASTRPLKFNADDWGVNETGSLTQIQYHSFSCSKCHNPHASRLPKLMITNCLDTKHNTWDNNWQLASVGTNNTNRSISNWTSSQNCHRRGGVDPNDSRADAAGVGVGWNKVTPW